MNTPLQTLVARVDSTLLRNSGDEAAILDDVDAALRELLSCDDWLDESCARPHPVHYQQYLLHADPRGRFSVVSFVWGPGQRTPIHDHCTWGVIGMLRGEEVARPYRVDGGRLVADGPEERLLPGRTCRVSPSIGDIHVVRNAHDDQVSISIHVYGSDIGKQPRHVYDPQSGAVKTFVSGYSNHPDYGR